MAEDLNFEAYADRLPPQNLDAEESILGGILLDPEAIARVIDILGPEAFYLEAHKRLFEAMRDLHQRGNPTDLISVTTWLKDRDLLEKVGGAAKLGQLVDRTVSAVNIDRYALLVADKFSRRQLIRVGTEIGQLAYETEELAKLLDRAEQKLFNVTQSDNKQDLVSAETILTETFLELERRSIDQEIPGLRCGFYDLDAMTQGFQRSDLVIVAGRPSMGKTSFVLNVGSNIAQINQLPIAIFSLEMSKEQLVYRLLSSEAQIETGRLRSGRVSEHEWSQIGAAINNLSSRRIFIDDTPNITITEMRSKCRRLQAEQGGALGAILLDYLQLMEGGGDNRVQELSKITRSLKGLARELNVPILALSQLSRGVESRTDKRPVMSDLRESGCLSGDTLIELVDEGHAVPIRELVGKSNVRVWALNQDTHKLEPALISHAFSTGIKPTFQLRTALGRTIRATANHQFLTLNGWQRLDQLTKESHGEKIALNLKSDELLKLSRSDVYWDKIVEIIPGEEEEVYDLTVPSLHNFVANNIIVHNSIEQDADLIIMLYREEYYNPDTPDRGVSEILIKKHRNGPTGVVKLLFEPEFTRFKNMANPNRY